MANICNKLTKGDPRAGDFACKDAFITVTVNDDRTYNVDGVQHDNGAIMTIDSISGKDVDALKKKYQC